jgi:competence protein ComEC
MCSASVAGLRSAIAALALGGWRLALVSGLAAGLALSPLLEVGEGPFRPALMLVCLIVLTGLRARFDPVAAALVVSAALLTGLAAGDARLAAIEGAALRIQPGTEVSLSGHAETPPRFSRGVGRFTFDSSRGRVVVEASTLPEGIGTGSGLWVSGTVRSPPDWYRPNLERQGIGLMLYAREVETTGADRGGVAGLIDRLRERAEAGLSRAMPRREAALAGGFVLGQDQHIDPATVTDFQNSGLAHLLAVSGQNVVLLSLLGIAFMALAGLGHRTRLVVLAGLILLYVPLAGGGPSIQRAGVMGLAGLAALAASRPASRLFVLALAAAVTLLINPLSASDVGWQLSFAAVIGIALLAGPIRQRLAGLMPTGEGPLGRGAGLRGLLADGAAVTVAASVVTAPLMALHFERIPVATVPANLMALPAVAPSMWLGMVSAALGTVWSGLSVPLNLINSLLLAYIAQVAAWFGRPAWAVLDLEIGSAVTLVPVYAALFALAGGGLWLSRRLVCEPGERLPATDRRRRAIGASFAVLVLLAATLILLPGSGRRDLAPPPPGGARIEILDIGQGDATLIRPSGTDPILVDGGPPGGGIESALASAGVGRLEAVVATHADLDHIGGLYEVFERHEVGSFLFDGTPRDLLNQAREVGSTPAMLSQGQSIRLGPLRIEVLWPLPRTADFVPPEDRNDRSIMLLLSLHGFRLLIAGDAEAEAVPVDPGPLDVLRTAHHGSDDAGLPGFLQLTRPRLSVISVGADNTYGHPTEDTLKALTEAGTEVLRTDLDGTISLVLSADGLEVETGR